MCDNNVKGSWCNGKDCNEDTPLDCFGNVCDGECSDIFEVAGDGMAAGIIVLIIILVCCCCTIVGCIVCCVMGVGCMAKKAAEAGAEMAAHEK